MDIVILTGAGISADSGLATFRDSGGIWERFDWQRLATHDAFVHDPNEVHAFYNMRREALQHQAFELNHADTVASLFFAREPTFSDPT